MGCAPDVGILDGTFILYIFWVSFLFVFRLVNVEDPKVIEIIEQMKKFQHSGKDILNGSVIMVNVFPLQTYIANVI